MICNVKAGAVEVAFWNPFSRGKDVRKNTTIKNFLFVFLEIMQSLFFK